MPRKRPRDREQPPPDQEREFVRPSTRLHDNLDAKERCVLFGVQPKDTRGRVVGSDEVPFLAELRALAETDGVEVVGELVQLRTKPDPNTYLGSGKIGELGELVEQTRAESALCNADLAPSQARNLEKEIGCRVVDRTELILDIFHNNARTQQAKAQVELARLQYSLPRLRRLWTHLERQRGGIGVRGGAGEKQLQVDKTMIKESIVALQRELQRINERKLREIATRAQQFAVSLVGYTNAGKSRLMNHLTDAGVLSENKLFSTLDTRTRTWQLGGGRNVLLSDTVGFIRGLPHHLVASFHATLEETIHADLLLHVVDASHPEALDQVMTVESVLQAIGAGDRPTLLLLNKSDLVADPLSLEPLRKHDPQALVISARTGDGIPGLIQWVQERADFARDAVWVAIPIARSRLQADVRRAATVLDQRFEDDRALFRVRARKSVLEELVAKGGVVLSDEEAGDGRRS